MVAAKAKTGNKITGCKTVCARLPNDCRNSRFHSIKIVN
jgi:hypothetical protein